MASIFSRIASGEIPAWKVAETSKYLAFLDVRPLAAGHTLVIPKEEVDQLFDMNEEAYIGLQLFARHVAEAIRKAVPCKRVGVAVIGLEVPHAHIHLIPLNSMEDVNWSKERLQFTPEEYKELAARISSFLPS
jgi:histidine triad (HIT) family protein